MAVGEVVFNTAMTGYQEILTDPSYFRQIVTLTYPHIGNTGVNGEDWESERIYAAGLVVRDLPRLHSSWRSPQTLDSFLKEQNVVAIADIDTRRLTRLLRSQGAQNGCLMAGEADAELALSEARDFPGLAGMDLAKVVTAQKPYEWSEGRWELGKGYRKIEQPRFHVVAYDYGIKRNILRMLAERGSRVTVVPAQFPAKEILRMKPDGVFLSNGPGDPEPCDYAIEAIGEILDTTVIPVFGICLGHQLMGLASGAKTVKMKFDYSGAQACKALRAEGYRVILVNSNPATIMTDPQMADATYIEPITWQVVARIIEKERPDALLPTMGGQTALNCALDLARENVLEKFGVEMIGASREAIDKAEDREKFKLAMKKIGLDSPRSSLAHSMEEALQLQAGIGFPVVIRPSFTLGGTGGGIAYNREEFVAICERGLEASPTRELLIEESVLGWDGFEMAGVRHRNDNCIIV